MADSPLHRIAVRVSGVTIAGHAQRIPLRIYAPAESREKLPIVLYFHGGGFLTGGLDCADVPATAISSQAPAIVVAVGYSLSPQFPFPAPLEDGYLAGRWAQANAQALGGDARRMAIAGYDAGGNLATGICAMARDRKDLVLRAQALLAPLLDPSMTRLADAARLQENDLSARDCAQGYRAYLPDVLQQLHPYAAPLESRRLGGLPPTLIVGAAQDLCHVEGELYAGGLLAAGVPTEASCYSEATHGSIVTHAGALAEVAAFLRLHSGEPAPRGRRTRPQPAPDFLPDSQRRPSQE
ncbi:alpha/beta hydrolase [Cupriavidus sp. 2TAF22]|uniref:alpha/beta hydrolase n=1 Tax=unclassified Cupriavidus TaxID=2640874 RepID=UPI003F8E0767